MNHTERARQRRIAEKQRMEALRQQVLYKNARVVPKPPKEELEEITKQAQLNSERVGQSAFKNSQQLNNSMKNTRQTAMLKHLLKGGTLSIKNAYQYFGISNVSREVRRLVELKLGIELKREQKEGKTKYGSSCYWYVYSATPVNKKVIAEYLKKNCLQ